MASITCETANHGSDGEVYIYHSTYAACLDGTGTKGYNSGSGDALRCGQATTTVYSLYQAAVVIDTTAIPIGSTITSATFRLKTSSDIVVDTDFDMTVLSKTITTPVDTSAFSTQAQLQSYTTLATLNTSAIGAINTYYSFTSTSDMLSAINVGGYTGLIVVSSNNISGTAPTGDDRLSFQQNGVSQSPQLIINYELPSMLGVNF